MWEMQNYKQKKTMENIEMLLKEAGSCMEHVCRIVVYLTDIRYREDVYKEMESIYFEEEIWQKRRRKRR